VKVKMDRLVIAEIGINHDGDELIAKKLIHDAFSAGCQAVKFQYRNLSRVYSSNHKEIGDEIISAELIKSELGIDQIMILANYAKNLGLMVGISCFTEFDLEEIVLRLDLFDFFKVPSVELLNYNLIDAMLATKKHTYISLGAHDEDEIEESLTRIISNSNWTPMHCISNYPTSKHNSRLGYLLYLQNKWNRPVGYSSHDESWEMCIVALTLGARVIERHITHSREAQGLDHSASSTVDSFSKLCEIAQSIDTSLLGNGPRISNQGEKLNRQNLGRSFFANRDLEVGSELKSKNFDYRSPQTGLNYQEFGMVLGQKLILPIKKGSVLSSAYVSDEIIRIDDNTIAAANKLKLSLPVRLHDYEVISREIPIDNFEFHLSFEEISGEIDIGGFNRNHTFSIHVPDYLDSKRLFDPFSLQTEIRRQSRAMLSKVFQFAQELSIFTEKSVTIVSSFTGLEVDKASFYQELSYLIEEHKNSLVTLTAQWLPPFAWYFGGSIPLRHLNSMEDLPYIESFAIPLTMDTSHLFLCRNFSNNDLLEIWARTSPFVRHIHLSDATGIDGEGLQLGHGDSENQTFFPLAIQSTPVKVLEIWQGHLNNYAGFKSGIKLAVKEGQ
jgi:sialic acid synthase SpsE